MHRKYSGFAAPGPVVGLKLKITDSALALKAGIKCPCGLVTLDERGCVDR